MTTPKPLLMSKVFWWNLVTALVTLSDIIPAPWGPAVSAIGNVILRVWFTQRPIGGLVPRSAN